MLKHTATIKSNATPYLKGRKSPTTSSQHIINLLPNTNVSGQGEFVSADGYLWMNVISTNPTCWAATQFMTNIVTVDETVPPVEPSPPAEFPPSIWVAIEDGGEQEKYDLVEE